MLILVTSGTGAWLIISQRGFVIGTLLITCSLFQISRLVNKLNSFNQKLRVFFDAIEDKDNMLYFPEQNVSKEQEKLNRSLNRINFLLAKTQSEYSKQEHFYRSLLEEVPSGVLAWDSTGKIIIANSTALSLLDCQQLTRYRQLESLLQEKGKKEHLSLSQSRMKLQDETITLLSIKDIGDELSDKESESWNKLSHVLTHEIMNTIAPIISLSQTLSTYPDINEKAVRGLRIIQAQSERLLQFTESFRHLSYLPKPEKKLFSLTATLQNLRELLSGDFKESNIIFTLTCEPKTIYMKGDENQLSQVLLNLLKNSMQALEGKEKGRNNDLKVAEYKTLAETKKANQLARENAESEQELKETMIKQIVAEKELADMYEELKIVENVADLGKNVKKLETMVRKGPDNPKGIMSAKNYREKIVIPFIDKMYEAFKNVVKFAKGCFAQLKELTEKYNEQLEVNEMLRKQNSRLRESIDEQEKTWIF